MAWASGVKGSDGPIELADLAECPTKASGVQILTLRSKVLGPWHLQPLHGRAPGCVRIRQPSFEWMRVREPR